MHPLMQRIEIVEKKEIKNFLPRLLNSNPLEPRGGLKA